MEMKGENNGISDRATVHMAIIWFLVGTSYITTRHLVNITRQFFSYERPSVSGSLKKDYEVSALQRSSYYYRWLLCCLRAGVAQSVQGHLYF